MTLKEFFQENPKAAIAFSGGIDSAYLLYRASEYAREVQAYFVCTVFQPEFEWEDAKQAAAAAGVPLKKLEIAVLDDEQIASNPENRCYFCKKQLFAKMKETAEQDGFPVLLDGTNASDEEGDRPGMIALRELGILSPLRLCGIDKKQIRKESRELGISIWDKPSYACLATRIPAGTVIRPEILKRVEGAEADLMKMGYRDFRVRVRGEGALLQLQEDQFSKYEKEKDQVEAVILSYFPSFRLDEKPRPVREN